MTRDGIPSAEVIARNWATYLRRTSDENVRRPLWDWPPSAVRAVKHERRRRFQFDIDSEGER
jgi:hypothetical protein